MDSQVPPPNSPMKKLLSLGLFISLTAACLFGMSQLLMAVTAPLVAQVDEFALAWPKLTPSGSTHEITYNHNGGDVFWVTGQTHDAIARVTLNGKATYFPMPDGSGPHGIVFDASGNLWVTLEYLGQIVQIDQTTGKVIKTVDVQLHAAGSAPINTHPHGLGVDPDGTTLWFTGKSTGTVGRINGKDGSVNHFALPTVGSVPIYIVAGPDKAMWCTELVGNQIAHITTDGKVTEFKIPTYNSRPIAITPGPDGKSMWFSEEAGNSVGRINLVNGKVVTKADGTADVIEYPVPKLHSNTILAALTFDRDGHLWTQAYVDPNNDQPPGSDAIVKIDRSILDAPPGNLSSVPVSYYQVPTENTVMHRITQGPDGALWFTELHADQVGRLKFVNGGQTTKLPGPHKNLGKSTAKAIRFRPGICG